MRIRTKIRRTRAAALLTASFLCACSTSSDEQGARGTDASQTGGLGAAAVQDGEPDEDGGTTRSPDEVVVTVNGEPITAAQLDESFRSYVGGQMGGMPPEQIENMRSMIEPQLVERLVADALVTQEVEEAEIEVAEEDVQEFLDEMLQQLPQGVGLEEYLANVGLDREELMERVRFKLQADEFFETVLFADLPEPTAEDVEGFYAENPDRFEVPEEVAARHILIGVEPEAGEEAHAAAEAEAEALRAKLVDEGADFAALAEAESDCPSSARGGDLGRFGRGRMVEPFEETAFSLDVDEISPVVETQFGYHVIQVTDHDEAGTVPLEEATETIREELLESRKQAKVEELVAALREEAEIVYPSEEGDGEDDGSES